MRTSTIVSRMLADRNGFMHLTRLRRLVDLCSAALNGQAMQRIGIPLKNLPRLRAQAVNAFNTQQLLH